MNFALHRTFPGLPFTGLLAVALALGAATGCNHYNTRVPGVLDLRTDGSGAAAAPPLKTVAPDMRRSGFDAFLMGDGVQEGSGVTVADRTWWVIALLPIANASAAEEVKVAMGDGALTKVTLGDGIAPLDAGITILATVIPCVGSLFRIVTPSWSFSLSGKRVAVPARSTPNPAPPADAAAPAAPAAPSPAGAAAAPAPAPASAPPPEPLVPETRPAAQPAPKGKP